EKGHLVLGDISGLTLFPVENGNMYSSALRFRGKAADINRSMRDLRYRGLGGRSGWDSIRVSVTDSPKHCPNATSAGTQEDAAAAASTCSLGGSLTVEGAITVHISPVNHPPRVILPYQSTSAMLDAETATDIALAVEDPDVRETAFYSTEGLRLEGLLSITISAERGLLSMRRRGGLSFSRGEGLDDESMHFSGSIDDTNSALSTLEYRCQSVHGCRAGTEKITVTVDDNGFTGRGGAMKTMTIVKVDVAGSPA
ncbi:unnamed protein product, partial [Discosporangium mesarthrocarpum]